jgi:hypothetical protein
VNIMVFMYCIFVYFMYILYILKHPRQRDLLHLSCLASHCSTGCPSTM